MKENLGLIAENPSTIKLSLTQRCNLRCIICNEHSKDTDKDKILDKDISEKNFYKLKSVLLGCKKIILAGNGEPTLTKKFFQKIRWIKRTNPDIQIELYTNGIMLANASFYREVTPLLDIINISVNGVENYSKITGMDYLEKVRDALNNIKKNKKTKICFVIMRSNIPDITKIAELAKEYNIDELVFTNLRIKRDIENESIRNNPLLIKLLKKELKKAKKIFPKISNKTFIDIEDSVFNKLSRILFKKTKRRIKCDYPWTTLQVCEDGRIKACCVCKDSIGDLNQDSLEKIWNGKEMQKYRKGILTKDYYKECKNCSLVLNNERPI